MECRRCGSTERLSIITKSKSVNGIKYYYICNECNRKRLIEYRKTNNGKKAVYKAIRKYTRKNKVRLKSWIVAEKLNKTMKPCVMCGKTPTHRHHPDINIPEYIVYLCLYHHKLAHKWKK